MRYLKYHALGNDYIVLPPALDEAPPAVETVRHICHRHYGVGSDGILYGPLARVVSLNCLDEPLQNRIQMFKHCQLINELRWNAIGQ